MKEKISLSQAIFWSIGLLLVIVFVGISGYLFVINFLSDAFKKQKEEDEEKGGNSKSNDHGSTETGQSSEYTEIDSQMSIQSEIVENATGEKCKESRGVRNNSQKKLKNAASSEIAEPEQKIQRSRESVQQPSSEQVSELADPQNPTRNHQVSASREETIVIHNQNSNQKASQEAVQTSDFSQEPVDMPKFSIEAVENQNQVIQNQRSNLPASVPVKQTPIPTSTSTNSQVSNTSQTITSENIGSQENSNYPCSSQRSEISSFHLNEVGRTPPVSPHREDSRTSSEPIVQPQFGVLSSETVIEMKTPPVVNLNNNNNKK